MTKEDIQNLIKELIEKTTVKTSNIILEEDNNGSAWYRVEVTEPHFFIGRDGEALNALNHLVRRIIETKSLNKEASPTQTGKENEGFGVLIDINGFQKKKVENARAVAHMMSERARYFKSNIEVDPMPAFERRVIHEFLSSASDLKTESVGYGGARRVVIKYIGEL